MITRVFIQSIGCFVQYVVHRLDADRRYRFIYKLENTVLNIGVFLNI